MIFDQTILEFSASVLTLLFLEIVLGIDNLFFISIAASKLPKEKQFFARTFGLVIALVGRFILLAFASQLSKLETPFLNVDFLNVHLSVRDLLFLGGGLFLLVKTTSEIFRETEGEDEEPENESSGAQLNMFNAIIQITMIDIVFSVDSIITAVGLVSNLRVICIAVFIACGVMIWLSGMISEFLDKHPSLKILALAFLILVGTILVIEAFHVHVPKGYIYFSLLFALFVEFINIKTRKPKKKAI